MVKSYSTFFSFRYFLCCEIKHNGQSTYICITINKAQYLYMFQTVGTKVDIYWLSCHLFTETKAALLSLLIYHYANFGVTIDTGVCHNDNLRCRQWRQSWHQGNNGVSVAASLNSDCRAVCWGSMMQVKHLTHQVLVKTYDDIDLSQHWLR